MKIIDYLLFSYVFLTICFDSTITYILLTANNNQMTTIIYYVTLLVFNIMMAILFKIMLKLKYDDDYTYYHTSFSLSYKNK